MMKLKIHRIKKILLIGIFLIFSFSCEKKMKMKIKDQAKQYVVIFGLVTNESATNSVTISTTENFDSKEENEKIDAVMRMESPFGVNLFVNSGNGYYETNGKLLARTPFRFSCAYKSKMYYYEVFTGDELPVDTILVKMQEDGRYKINATLVPLTSVAFSLKQLYVGKINTGKMNSDTTWTKYNDAFPGAKPKINFLSPDILFQDSAYSNTFEIIKNAPLKSNDLLKLEIYSIDPTTAQYLHQLDAPDNYSYDPLSIAPPLNYFAFSNDALGVIIPAIKSRKIIKIE